MPSSMRAPTSWRIICARSASAPRLWSGCASSARPRCSSGSSASSRPAAPICRSILPTRRSVWPSCWKMRRAPVLITQSAVLDRSTRAWRPHRAARCRLASDRRATHDRTRAGARPAQHRLRHLHLRLHRNAEGRGGLTMRWQIGRQHRSTIRRSAQDASAVSSRRSDSLRLISRSLDRLPSGRPSGCCRR